MNAAEHTDPRLGQLLVVPEDSRSLSEAIGRLSALLEADTARRIRSLAAPADPLQPGERQVQ